VCLILAAASRCAEALLNRDDGSPVEDERLPHGDAVFLSTRRASRRPFQQSFSVL
jgi:hypothetical protein